jgi:hypothetical protein
MITSPYFLELSDVHGETLILRDLRGYTCVLDMSCVSVQLAHIGITKQ